MTWLIARGNISRRKVIQMKIQHLTLPENRRILVTSDIHGHAALFKALLDKAGFSKEDILVIIGDIVEKGPESLKTLRYVMELCDEYGRDRVIVLSGNVDLWLLQTLEGLNDANSHDLYRYLEKMREWKGTSLYDEMALEQGIRLDSPEKAAASGELLLEKFRREFEFLRSLPAIVETQKYIFVHAGLPVEDGAADLEALRERNIYDVLKFDNFMSAGLSFRKYVVVGHWPARLYHDRIARSNPIVNRKQHIISIDGGCGLKKDGQLNMLIIPDIDCTEEEITSVYCDGFRVARALDFQEESKDSIHIHWGDNKIRVLQRGEEFSEVEHISSGYRLKMRNEYIYDLQEASGEARCEDYTDYLLPVKPGNELSLVCRTSEGYLVKKDGVTGWYKGRLEEG